MTELKTNTSFHPPIQPAIYQAIQPSSHPAILVFIFVHATLTFTLFSIPCTCMHTLGLTRARNHAKQGEWDGRVLPPRGPSWDSDPRVQNANVLNVNNFHRLQCSLTHMYTHFLSHSHQHYRSRNLQHDLEHIIHFMLYSRTAITLQFTGECIL